MQRFVSYLGYRKNKSNSNRNNTVRSLPRDSKNRKREICYARHRPAMSMLWMRTGLRILEAADIGGWMMRQLRMFIPVLSSSFSVRHIPFFVCFKYLFFCRLLNDSQRLFWTWTSAHHRLEMTFKLETTMGMGFPMGMGIPWDSHGNGNWW